MLDEQQLIELEQKTLLLGRRWTQRYLKQEAQPSKEEVEHEMISLAVINQELLAEVKRLKERLAEVEEARQCAILTIDHLEDRCRSLEVDLLLSHSRTEYQQLS